MILQDYRDHLFHNTPPPPQTVVERILSAVEQYAMIRTTRIRSFIEAIREIGQYLADNPLMTNSAQQEPIYDRPRTHADVRDELANQLANLPNHHARCKILLDGKPVEGVIKTNLADPPVSQPEFARRMERIRAIYLENGYGRERSEVQKEIMRRQQMGEVPKRREATRVVRLDS
jgi:hypothetical protein